MKSCLKLLLLILLLSFIHPDSVMGQAKVLSFEQDQNHIWSQEFTYALASENDVKDIQSLPDYTDEKWVPMGEVEPNNVNRETWCKTAIHNPNSQTLSLRFSYQFMADTVTMYIKTDQGLVLKNITGYRFPYHNREVNSWVSSFLLNVLPQDTLQLYYRVVTENPEYRSGLLYPRIAQSHLVSQGDVGKAAFQFGFLSMTLVLALIGLLAFFFFKERDFLYYSVLMVSIAMNVFLASFIHQLFIEPWSFWDLLLRYIPFISFIAISLFLFLSNRLDLRERSAKLYAVYKWTSIAAALLALPFYFVQKISLLPLFGAGSGLLITFSAFIIVIQAKRVKHPEANTILVSLSILILSSFLASALALIAPSKGGFFLLGVSGHLIFAVSLLFSLFKKISTIRLERLRAQVEQEKSDELLFNVLPEEIALELKNTGKSEATQVENVSVLFSDFKGFTALSEKLSPKELVKDLNECFSAFDRIMEKHGIEKIKTIGDAYMAAGGLSRSDSHHVKSVVLAAMDMRDFVEDGKARKIENGQPIFEIRIGVHTGPVVAGIVGVKKFQYDIWGDTVNTASRMESSSEVGKVNISQSTYELLKDDPLFTFRSRGKVEAKGKGEMEMYFVSRT
jgi:class 3 adenylate cyclase